MTIKVVTSAQAPLQTVALKPSFPFIWRSNQSNRVFLRVAPRRAAASPPVILVDVLLEAPPTYAQVDPVGALAGTLMDVCIDDAYAWRLRVPAAITFTLSNDS